ncbi:MAG TPA: hypothetical protein GXX20_08345 [Clostridiaceae bacterium]|nr:hypothetical protein [Clostridiaceae bacterium]
MLIRYISFKRKSSDKILTEKIQRELTQSLKNKGIGVSKITINYDSDALNISVYIDEKAYNFC